MTVKSLFLTTIKTKTPWQTWWLHLSKSQPSSLSSVAIFRYHERTKFTSHNSYAILEYIDLLDRVHLLTQKLLKQSYVDHKLKSSLQKLYDCQDSSSRSGWPVTKYQNFKWQWIFSFLRRLFFFFISPTRLLYIGNTSGVLWEAGTACLSFARTWVHRGFWWDQCCLSF